MEDAVLRLSDNLLVLVDKQAGVAVGGRAVAAGSDGRRADGPEGERAGGWWEAAMAMAMTAPRCGSGAASAQHPAAAAAAAAAAVVAGSGSTSSGTAVARHQRRRCEFTLEAVKSACCSIHSTHCTIEPTTRLHLRNTQYAVHLHLKIEVLSNAQTGLKMQRLPNAERKPYHP